MLSAERLSERFKVESGDVNLLIPLERHRGRLEQNVEKGIRLSGGEYAKTMRGEYVAKVGENCFTVKIIVDGEI